MYCTFVNHIIYQESNISSSALRSTALIRGMAISDALHVVMVIWLLCSFEGTISV